MFDEGEYFVYLEERKGKGKVREKKGENLIEDHNEEKELEKSLFKW